ncbi:choloylglycine hydrolase family protein [Eubacteriaceae bacterium ES2]|nr:choloylglycine hydrolase family protein [Eubacteriaceae bacterium ES2]
MCTSLTYKTNDEHHFLARTMDFAFLFKPEVLIYPKNYDFRLYMSDDLLPVKYAFMGFGQSFEDNYDGFADGVNEKGLSCAALYFPGYAYYSNQHSEKKNNIAPYEVVPYILSQCDSIDSVIELMRNTNLLAAPFKNLDLLPPLHFIISDQTGRCIIIEPRENDLEILENSIGIMTNSPPFDWHMTNLNNFIGLHPSQNKDINLSGVTFKPFSQGFGTIGLPGDFTSPSRFVKTTFSKFSSTPCDLFTDGMSTIFHILDGVSLIKGSVVTEDQDLEFTQYTACYDLTTQTLYYKTYGNSQINAVSLSFETIHSNSISSFHVSMEQSVLFQN